MFSGRRIRQARELRGLTQVELAERIGVTQAAIAYFERDLKQPSLEIVAQIASQTKFPIAFFSASPPAMEFPTEALLFRSHASLTKREIASASRNAEIALEIFDALSADLTEIPITLPRCSREPERAAHQVRAAFKLSPDTPIPNLIYLVERLGVLVLSLPETSPRLDAFSLWVGPNKTQPLIVLSGNRPSDRLRLSIAHDLGHLTMLHPSRYRAEEEREAWKFAAELLLPEKAMRREVISPVTLSSIAVLKPRWGVSIAALIRRAHELNIVSERQYRYLFEQLSAKGWRKAEPSNLDVAEERPRALRQMAEMNYGDPIKYEQLAADMKLNSEFVKKLLNCYSGRAIFRETDNKQPSGRKIIPFKKFSS